MTAMSEQRGEGIGLVVGVEPGKLEEAFARIPGVEAARVVQGSGGIVSEVHVLATRDRSAKQLVRDIQSVSVASFGVDIDYRKISIVQLENGSGTERGSAHHAIRPAVVRMASESEGHETKVEVVLAHGARSAPGSARGPATSGMRLVAAAVVNALGNLGNSIGAEIEFTDVVAGGRHQVALTVVRVATPRGEHVVSGCAVVRKDPADAVARATLAALNRLIDSE